MLFNFCNFSALEADIFPSVFPAKAFGIDAIIHIIYSSPQIAPLFLLIGPGNGSGFLIS